MKVQKGVVAKVTCRWTRKLKLGIMLNWVWHWSQVWHGVGRVVERDICVVK